MRRTLLALLVILGTIGCDQLTKRVAVTRLDGMSRLSYLEDTLRLEYVENSGAFLGLGAAMPEWARVGLLMVAPAIVLLVLAAAAIRSSWSGLFLLGGFLVVAGGTSNLVDRVARGSVVDFVSIGVGNIRTGIFNFADVALVAGIAVMLMRRREEPGEGNADVQDGPRELEPCDEPAEDPEAG